MQLHCNTNSQPLISDASAGRFIDILWILKVFSFIKNTGLTTARLGIKVFVRNNFAIAGRSQHYIALKWLTSTTDAACCL